MNFHIKNVIFKLNIIINNKLKIIFNLLFDYIFFNIYIKFENNIFKMKIHKNVYIFFYYLTSYSKIYLNI